MIGSDFEPDLSFLHLSDIHFRRGQMGDVHDVDSDLRNELERDLRTFIANRIQRVDGMIVSGDIAFSGQPEEFAFGKGWIEKIRELIDCPEGNIMITPGNHDVDWASINADVEALHEQISAAETLPERDRILADILRDPVKGSQLLASISAYNDLANEYNCAVSREKPFWERDFPLGKMGSVLRIRGVTSTLISSSRDHNITHKMVYGGAQRTLMRERQVFRLLVGHHPPSWTLEGDDVDRAFGERAAIQLFGHKHDVWYLRGRGIRIIAGAVQPERQEAGWEPRYSIFSVKLGAQNELQTRVYPRRWSKEETTFIPDYNSLGHDYRDHIVDAEMAA